MTARDVERFRRLEALFDSALALPAAARDAWLREQTAGDATLLDEVRRLLADDSSISESVEATPEPPPRFGPWQVVRLLGRGGMGTVYLAERADGTFRMQAAVKVVPLALASLEIEERFRRERQFLASLDHPKVARLIDGGVTAAGLPYLVMEFVDGLAIDRYCDALHLDSRARIGLLRQVLEALIYIHGQQVMHRDLKPSNILVDTAGSVKLLDFGTARLMDAGGDAAITKTGVFAFTPECASPEQVQGKPVTFATDIYAAGVLLYRLLTGRPPDRLDDRSGLDKRLDAIVTTALRKDPAERYGSAAEMDADLVRYLNGARVHARPRWKPWVTAVVAAVVVCGLAVWVWKDRAAAAKPPPSIAVLPFTNANADAANQYLVDGLTAELAGELGRMRGLRIAPQSAAAVFRKLPRNVREIGSKLRVSHVLDASVERAAGGLTIVASLARTSDGARLWTNTYRRPAADLESIQRDLELGIAAALGVSAPAPPKHEPSREAHDFYLKGRFEENRRAPAANATAQQHFRRALDLDPDYAAAYAGLGAAVWNRNTIAGERPEWAQRRQAEQLFLKAIQLDPALPQAHTGLGAYAMQYDWDWKRAEREFQAALAAGSNAAAETPYATLCLLLGRRQEADEHLRREQDLDSVSAAAQSNQARFLELEGRYAESLELFRRLAAQNPDSLLSQADVSRMEARTGAPGRAIENLRKLAKRLPAASQYLATAEAIAGNREAALRILRELEKTYPRGNIFACLFAQVYAELGDEAEAVKWLERSMELREFPAIYIHVEPAFAKMQESPRFHALKKRMNLDW